MFCFQIEEQFPKKLIQSSSDYEDSLPEEFNPILDFDFSGRKPDQPDNPIWNQPASPFRDRPTNPIWDQTANPNLPQIKPSSIQPISPAEVIPNTLFHSSSDNSIASQQQVLYNNYELSSFYSNTNKRKLKRV
jgi:hypothetical protein